MSPTVHSRPVDGDKDQTHPGLKQTNKHFRFGAHARTVKHAGRY